MPAPAHPKLYHIVHVDRLAPIIASRGLASDRILRHRGAIAGTTIGMGNLKAKRFSAPVTCHPDTFVSDYVPFYLCPRSIMLYVIHMANHPSLEYRGGQRPIVHLELDLHRVVAWAEETRLRWAFSLGNATALYAEFRDDLAQLDEIDWAAVASADFRDPAVKESKQSEVLIHRGVPWDLVERIGVHDHASVAAAAQALDGAVHRPRLEVMRDWYY